MNELEFRIWLDQNNYSKKMQSDIVSRIKKLERANNFTDIEETIKIDNGLYLLSIFRNKGINDDMAKLNASYLPIGKYQLSTYKYAVKLYLKFKST